MRQETTDMNVVEPSEDKIIKVLSGRSRAQIENNDLKPAGVLIPIFVKDGCWHLLLTKRTDTVEAHKGEISFPGGHMEPDDPDLVCTALREAEEEVGIPADQVKVLGRLDDIFTVTSNFRITPVVGRIPYPMDFRPAPAEIAQIIIAPLAEYNRPENISSKEMDYQGSTYPAYFFNVGGHMVWGATAMILKQFLELCLGPGQE